MTTEAVQPAPPRPVPAIQAKWERARTSALSSWGRLRESTVALWSTVCGLLLLWLVLLTPFGRPLWFDEAVFVSQSGGLDGTHGKPWQLQASREYGTWVIVKLFRPFAHSLGSIELLWMLVMFALVTLAFYASRPIIGQRAALVGLAVFCTFWLPAVMMSAIYGSVGAAAGALLATSLYLRLRDASPQAIGIGIATGLALALMCWMRTFEAAVAGLVIVAHVVLWRPRDLLTRWRAVVAAVVTFVLTFAVPWILETIHRWGSLSGWWHAARSQGSTEGRHGHAFGLYDGVPNYAGMFVGRAGRYLHAPVALAVLTGLLLIVVALLVAWITVIGFLRARRQVRDDSGPERNGAILLYFAQGALGLGAFLFFAQGLEERYTMFGCLFGAALAGIAIDYLLTRVARRQGDADRRRLLAAGAGALALLWLVTQALMIHDSQNQRIAAKDPAAQLGALIRVLDNGHRCHLLGQASASYYTITSDCTPIGSRHLLLKPGQVEAALTSKKHPGKDFSVFVMWRPSIENVDVSGPGWVTLRKVFPPHPSWLLTYHLAGPG